MLDESRPIFVQVAELIENTIIDGSLPEGSRVPSTNELAEFHRINPATAAKGVQQLVAHGLLEKRRGIGMFVTAGTREMLRERRRREFAARFVQPLVTEARKIGIDTDELKRMIDSRRGLAQGDRVVDGDAGQDVPEAPAASPVPSEVTR